MTCIVGLVDDCKVYIGGDSAAISTPPYHDLVVRADEKVFRNGPFVIGFTSSYRMGQLLRYKLLPPRLVLAHGDLHRFMATAFVDAVRDCLQRGGYARNERVSRHES